VRLRRTALDELAPRRAPAVGEALFICTHNSARSQLAATLWRARTGTAASSAGTEPADEVHAGARAAATRHGLDLGGAAPRRFEPRQADRATVVITVCDQAHEALAPPTDWWHWSVPDPVDDATASTFDAVVDLLDRRIAAVASSPPSP
jgi:protein-tyrosine-phosphatase